jgi:hypothetical protein
MFEFGTLFGSIPKRWALLVLNRRAADLQAVTRILADDGYIIGQSIAQKILNRL